MERAFGADFSGVRFRQTSLPPRVVASTRGEEVAFRPGTPPVESPLMSPLVAHELAHVVQSRNGTRTGARAEAEREASRAALDVARGNAPRLESPAPAEALHSELSDQLNADWAANHDKGRIFDILRRDTARGDSDARAALRSMFAPGSDDIWLAETLLDNGPETLWPTPLIDARVARARGPNPWAAEAGDIGAALPDPYGVTPGPTVRAFFFPGQTARRALIIGGIHGTEQQGADTVDLLRAALRTRSLAGNPPYFTTILVPTLFEQTHRGGRHAGLRHVPGGIGRTSGGTLQRSRHIEPNRNYPLPGEDLAAARARGAGSATAPELVFRDAAGTVRPAQDTPDVTDPSGRIVRRGQTGTSIRMLAETRILIGLIERFQPERLATVHAHSLKTTIGDAPGIFVDPRGIDPATGRVTNQAQVDEDDRLATAMVREGTRRWSTRTGGVPGTSAQTGNPFVGNAPGTAGASVRYSSTATPEGNSLGTWAPVPTVAGTAGARVSRPGITTITVEIPQWTAGSQTRAQQEIQELHRDLLIEIFLGNPTTATPASTPTRPGP